MTTLHRPVLIESAEQGEALPIGTVATLADSEGASAFVLADDGIQGPGWHCEHEIKEHEYVVGWTALVPIEVEEEWAVSHDRDAPAWSSVTKESAQNPGADETAHVRYVTAWEEA